MEKTTKERILIEAFRLFAENGYKGTNLRDLAARLGITKSALYKHYESIDDIWESLLDYLDVYYNAHFEKITRDSDVPKDVESFVSIVLNMVRFTVEDEYVSMARRLVAMEEYHDSRTRALATNQVVDMIQERFVSMFESMMDMGLIEKDDPEFLSLIFVAPISVMVRLSDRETDRKERIIEQIEAFATTFAKRIGLKEGSYAQH